MYERSVYVFDCGKVEENGKVVEIRIRGGKEGIRFRFCL